MRTCLLLATIFSAVIALSGCKRSSPAGEKAETAVTPGQQNAADEPPNLRFNIKRVPITGDSAGFQNYDCAYQAGGKVAKFRLRLKQYGPLHGEIIPMALTEGSFIALDASDNSVLLRDLTVALDAKRVPTRIVRAKELRFDAVILAEHQSESGGYCAKPCGDWTSMKIFLSKGGDEGEVFLNFNPVLGKAEFSIKDSDYGDYLLEQFAKVL